MKTLVPQSRIRRRRGVAFTLLELLIVVAIIAVMAAAGVPAIRNIIYTSTASLAESQLRLALNAARDLAIRNSSGDAAAVFTFEPGGRLTIVPVVYAGTLLDGMDPGLPYTGNANQVQVYREVFAPTPLVESVQLPPGWMVRGFAPPLSIYNNSVQDITNSRPAVMNGWYQENFYNAAPPRIGNRQINLGTDTIIGSNNRGNWVFPENAFFDETQKEEGDYRQTFMIRFQSGTGKLVAASSVPSVVLLPRSRIDTSKNPNSMPVLAEPLKDNDWRRVDRADNLVAWARSVLSLPSAEAAALIGARSTDCVTVNAVSMVGLYEESRMAAAIGAGGVNKITGCIYGTTPTDRPQVGTAAEAPKAPNIDLALWGNGTVVRTQSDEAKRCERVQMQINSYMIGALKGSDVFTGLSGTAAGAGVEADVRLFVMDSYLGDPKEAKP
ncbi:MAG: prepilin-type N-terminal cleavage/methylation domain-containing protein [Phycisphaerales bacterium]|nr:prepilin-type N-terminal cleavage/methylation domain-containing protein [Phycisphaerales bacterium]